MLIVLPHWLSANQLPWLSKSKAKADSTAHIQLLSNLDSDPIILLGGLPNVGALCCSVHLLFRENNLPIYDENFVEIGWTEGHFWLEDRGSTMNGVGQAPSNPALLGNGTGSGLIQP
jgi:hypothetical protein